MLQVSEAWTADWMAGGLRRDKLFQDWVKNKGNVDDTEVSVTKRRRTESRQSELKKWLTREELIIQCHGNLAMAENIMQNKRLCKHVRPHPDAPLVDQYLVTVSSEAQVEESVSEELAYTGTLEADPSAVTSLLRFSDLGGPASSGSGTSSTHTLPVENGGKHEGKQDGKQEGKEEGKKDDKPHGKGKNKDKENDPAQGKKEPKKAHRKGDMDNGEDPYAPDTEDQDVRIEAWAQGLLKDIADVGILEIKLEGISCASQLIEDLQRGTTSLKALYRDIVQLRANEGGRQELIDRMMQGESIVRDTNKLMRLGMGMVNSSMPKKRKAASIKDDAASIKL